MNEEKNVRVSAEPASAGVGANHSVVQLGSLSISADAASVGVSVSEPVKRALAQFQMKLHQAVSAKETEEAALLLLQALTSAIKSGHVNWVLAASAIDDAQRTKTGRKGLPATIRFAICRDYELMRQGNEITQAEYVDYLKETQKIDISLPSFQRYYREYRESGASIL